MPAFCLYKIKQDIFECPEKTGKQVITGIILGSYFQDFADGKTTSEIALMPKKKRPSIVLIYDFNRFINMIKAKLVSIGIKEENILLYDIDYSDNKKEPFLCLDPSPNELSIKDKTFKHQSEFRIVVNTTNKSEIEMLVGKTIDIGSTKELATKSDIYLYEGAIVKMASEIEEINEV